MINNYWMISTSRVDNGYQRISAYVVLLSNLLDVIDDLKAESRVETTGGFIEEEDLRISNKSTGNSKTFLLTTTESFLDRCTNNGMCL